MTGTGAAADRGAPGKATRVAELENSAMYRGPTDVSAAARAEVAGAFGARAHGIDYTVGAGGAEARGANAVAIGGKVDFAPGQFDLASPAGRARLGEETAHAVQQTNRGEPSGVPALEGEAVRAGRDFAMGGTPRIDLAAPAGSALADDPKADKVDDAKDKDKASSPEVPDLQNGEVAKLKAVIATDRDEALRLMLLALQRIDATAFASTDLTDKKLHKGGGSSTRQGPAFEAWLETYLDGVATGLSKARNKLTKAEVKKAIHDAAPPADKKDILVTMGTPHFASVSLLYSSVRHEFVHVQQLRTDYLTQIPTHVMPSGVDAPDSGTLDKDREVEAYLWEMEHLANTGLTDPSELHLLWESCSNAFLNAGPATTATLGPKFKAAFRDVWKKAMDGHIAAIDAQYKAFKTSGAVAEPSKVQTLRDDMEQMWNYRNNYGIVWSPYVASHKTALDQATEMIGAIKVASFMKLLDDVDTKLKAGPFADSDTAFFQWENVTAAWNGLDAAAKTAQRARYDKTAPGLWKATFTALQAEIRKRIADGEADVAQELMDNSVGDLFKKADKSVKTADFQKDRQALQAEIAKAKQAKGKTP